MTGLSHLLDHSRFLACDSQPCGVLARTHRFALSCPCSTLDRHVGGGCDNHGPLARRPALWHSMDLASSRCSLHRGNVALLGEWPPVQPASLIGVPELRVGHTDQNLVTTDVHGFVRNPIY